MNQSLFSRLRAASLVFGAMVALSLGIAGCDQTFTAPDPNSPTPATATIQPLITGTLANWRYIEINEFIGTVGRESYTSAGDDPRILQEPIANNIDAGAFICLRPWSSMYFTIANCRNLIVFAATQPAAARAGIEGIAKTIWAHELLRLSNVWYDAGIKIEYRLDASAPLVPRAQALAEVNRLLDEANTALGAAGSSFPFEKFGDGFVGFNTPAQFARVNRAIRARTAAYQGDYAACLTALNASFIREGNTPADMTFGVNHVFTTQPGDVPPGARGGTGGSPFFQNLAAPSIRWWAQRNYFSDNTDNTVDTRVTQKTATPTGISVPFTIQGGGGITSTRAINLYPDNTTPASIIRNEELLLLRAEARMFGATPDLAGALADINRVRAAANAPQITTVGADRAAQTTRLLYERRYSLFFEGFRWVDMKRFGRLSSLPVEATGHAVSQTGWPTPVREIPQ
jgi:starch-binding outer membrane protein, SusD/RagB family